MKDAKEMRKDAARLLGRRKGKVEQGEERLRGWNL